MQNPQAMQPTPKPQRTRTRRLAQPLAITLLLMQMACATVDAPWPEKAVTLEQMPPLVPLKTRWLTKNVIDKSLPPVTVVVHAHVDAEGRPIRVRLERSGGNPRQDEAALQTIREARFAPHRGADGVAMPVSLVAALLYWQERAADKGLTTVR